MSFTLQKKVALGFILTLGILFFIGYSFYDSLTGLLDAYAWRGHSFQVIIEVKELITTINDAQRGQRGYINTGDLSFLKTYPKSVQNIKTNLSELHQLTVDNVYQKRQLDELDPLVQQALNFFQYSIEVRKKEGFGKAFKLVNAHPSFALITRIRTILNRIDAEEQHLLTIRGKMTEDSVNRTTLIAIGGILFILLILMTLLYMISREIEERQRAEQALIAARNEAELASKQKSEFLANMSHEIRTPMNGVLGMTEIVLNTELTTEQRHSLELVFSSGEALIRIINDILDFSKIEAGHLVLDPFPFQLRETVIETLSLFAKQAASKNLNLYSHIEPTVPNHFIGDSYRLRQILNNLLSNAVKFTEQGEVCLGIELAEIQGSNAELHLWVSDTGIGLTEDQQLHIFEPFVQGDGSMTRRYGGTGLGLSISRQLVELMGGWLWLESEEGKGSTFHLNIELALQEESAELRMPVAPKERLMVSSQYTENNEKQRPLRVLLAEDNEINQMIVTRILNQAGHRVDVAHTGQEAIALAENQAFDLILMDVHMPDMDGMEATRLLREQERLTGDKHIPVIALTANAIKGDRERCLEAGMDGYISKPFRQVELLEAIVTLTGGRSEASQPQEEPLDALINSENLLSRFGGDRALLGRAIAILKANIPPQLIALDAAIALSDAKAVEEIAHAVKGTIGNFTTGPVFQTASQLERMGRERDLSNAASIGQTLKTQLETLQQSLDAFVSI